MEFEHCLRELETPVLISALVDLAEKHDTTYVYLAELVGRENWSVDSDAVVLQGMKIDLEREISQIIPPVVYEHDVDLWRAIALIVQAIHEKWIVSNRICSPETTLEALCELERKLQQGWFFSSVLHGLEKSVIRTLQANPDSSTFSAKALESVAQSFSGLSGGGPSAQQLLIREGATTALVSKQAKGKKKKKYSTRNVKNATGMDLEHCLEKLGKSALIEALVDLAENSINTYTYIGELVAPKMGCNKLALIGMQSDLKTRISTTQRDAEWGYRTGRMSRWKDSFRIQDVEAVHIKWIVSNRIYSPEAKLSALCELAEELKKRRIYGFERQRVSALVDLDNSVVRALEASHSSTLSKSVLEKVTKVFSEKYKVRPNKRYKDCGPFEFQFKGGSLAKKMSHKELTTASKKRKYHRRN